MKHTVTSEDSKGMVELKRGEHGLTLVEVLATLVILSIAGILVWSIFFQGLNFSNKSISKNFMIQESNLLITDLKQIHQTSEEYKIVNSGCEIKIQSKKKDDPKSLDLQPEQVFKHSKICFTFDKLETIVKESTSKTDRIEPNKDDLSITLTASDQNDRKNAVTIKTLLYKVKGADY